MRETEVISKLSLKKYNNRYKRGTIMKLQDKINGAIGKVVNRFTIMMFGTILSLVLPKDMEIQKIG